MTRGRVDTKPLRPEGCPDADRRADVVSLVDAPSQPAEPKRPTGEATGFWAGLRPAPAPAIRRRTFTPGSAAVASAVDRAIRVGVKAALRHCETAADALDAAIFFVSHGVLASAAAGGDVTIAGFIDALDEVPQAQRDALKRDLAWLQALRCEPWPAVTGSG